MDSGGGGNDEEKSDLPDVARGESNTWTKQVVEVIAAGKEKQQVKSFGVDTPANAMLEFFDQYKLCVEINQGRGVPGWDSPK